jgi:hypothetical protein
MQYHYATSTCGLYTPEIHTDITSDAVSISAEYYSSLIDGQSNGKVIMPPDDWHPLPYLADPPLSTPEQLAAMRRAEIFARLAEIDAASVRPLRAIANGDDVQADHTKLTALDAEAAELRAELAGLPQSA